MSRDNKSTLYSLLFCRIVFAKVFPRNIKYVFNVSILYY